MSTLRLLWIANDAARLRQSWMDRAPRPVYYEFTTNLAEGVQRLNRGAADVVLLTLPVEHWTAIELIERLRCVDPAVPVVVQLPESDFRLAFSLARLGASDVLGVDCPAEQVWEGLLAAGTSPPTPGEPGDGVREGVERHSGRMSRA